MHPFPLFHNWDSCRLNDCSCPYFRCACCGRMYPGFDRVLCDCCYQRFLSCGCHFPSFFPPGSCNCSSFPGNCNDCCNPCAAPCNQCCCNNDTSTCACGQTTCQTGCSCNSCTACSSQPCCTQSCCDVNVNLSSFSNGGRKDLLPLLLWMCCQK